MSIFVKMEFCALPATPWNFNKEKFLADEEKQTKLYNDSKPPNRDKTLSYEEITDEKKNLNYARVVPKGCAFIDYDNKYEFERIKEIVLKAKSNCLILDTPHGGQFLYRKPDFYEKEMTGATNWLGMKFDTKGSGSVQIMRVCGMNRKEITSWDGKEVVLEELDIEKLDVLPFWLWGNLKNKDLFKGGKTDTETYHVTDTPFTRLMVMSDGNRHDHIFSRCSFFAVANGFTLDEFKSLITVIHDNYLVKIGTLMPDSDLFGDLEERWTEYEETLTSSGYSYNEKKRKWEKVKSKKEEKISPQKSCEFLYKKYDFYVMGSNYDTGEGGQLCYITSDSRISFDLNIMWKELREIFFEQDFDTHFYKEVKEQLIQRCNENKKYFNRNNKYYVCKNGTASCISDDIYSFDYFTENDLMPTDLIYDWNLHDRKWVDEHESDLGRTYN